MAKVPDFLVIGSMKAGTTSLYADLKRHPKIFLPERKELNLLNRFPKDSISNIRDGYARYYEQSHLGSTCGEFSTQYSKFPTFPYSPYVAEKIFPGSVKIVYMIRNPVERLRSQHHHEFPHRQTPRNIREAVEFDHRLLLYSAYFLQLSRWLDFFPHADVAILPFERYLTDRDAVLRALYGFLNVEAGRIEGDAPAENMSSERRVFNPMAAAFARTNFYREKIRPRITPGILSGFRKVATLRKAPSTRPEMPADLISFANEILRPDFLQLVSLLGVRASEYEELVSEPRFNLICL